MVPESSGTLIIFLLNQIKLYFLYNVVYIICRAQDKMKMWSPLLTNIHNLKIATIELEAYHRPFSGSGAYVAAQVVH